jgi:hypothetical protein
MKSSLYSVRNTEVRGQSGENIYLMTGKVDNYIEKVSLNKFAHPKMSR